MYASPLYCPFTVKDINAIELIQKYISRSLFPAINKSSYTDRLRYLNLEILELKFICSSLLAFFRIIKGLINLQSCDFSLEHCNSNRIFIPIIIPHVNSNHQFESQFTLLLY